MRRHEQPLTVPPFNAGVTPSATLVVDCRLSEHMCTPEVNCHVAVMAIVGPFPVLHVALVAEAGRLPVSEREATPHRKSAYFDVSASL